MSTDLSMGTNMYNLCFGGITAGHLINNFLIHDLHTHLTIIHQNYYPLFNRDMLSAYLC